MAGRRDSGNIRQLPSGRCQTSFIGPDLARLRCVGDEPVRVVVGVR